MLAAFDISLSCGISWGGQYDGRPKNMLVRLPEGNQNFFRALAVLRGSAYALFCTEGIEAVVTEAAMMHVDWQHGKYPAYLLVSLNAVVCEAAQAAGAHVIDPIPASTWRSSFLGSARGTTAELKRRAMDRNDQLGWTYKDHNTAESNCLWGHAMAMRYPQWAPNRPKENAA
jgi:hypothetical protein